VLILTLFLATPVFAQDADPPQPAEPEESIESPEASALTSTITKQTLPENPAAPSREVQLMPRSLVEIETRWSDQNSASDHGGNYVAVAHNSDNEIHVFLYYYGVYIARFEVSDGSGNSSLPAIAYEASSGFFIVTWQYNHPTEGWNIQAVAVDPNNWGNHNAGSIVDVAGSSWDETDPSLDCNYFDHSCLIVHNLDNGSDFYRIDGRYMKINATTGLDEGASSPNFAISTLENEENPYVAWSEPNKNYMVAYTWPATGGGEQYPVHSVVMEYYDYGADPVLVSTSYSIGTDWLNDNDKFTTGIAYDNCTEQYAIVFTHDYNGDNSDLDIFATIIDGSTYFLNPLVAVAASTANEFDADISYLNDANIAENTPNPDRLVIAYTRFDYLDLNGIIATDLRGNCYPPSPQYQTDPGILHTVVMNSENSAQQPSITGSNNGREFFVAYTYNTGLNFNVYGRYMNIVFKGFLPLMVK
jgi:hypothetical protein